MYDEYLKNALVFIITARQVLASYDSTGIRNFKNIAAYNAQQAVEFIVKYHIYNEPKYNKGKTEQYVPQIYSHDIDYLITKYCSKLSISVPGSIRNKAEMISRWEAESRYKLSFSARVTSIRSVLDVTEKWLCSIKPKYKQTIQGKRKKYR